MHRVSFPRTGLSVGHYGAVKPVQNVVEYWTADLIENFFLGAFHVEHAVIHERHFFGSGITDDELGSFVDAVEPSGVGSHFLAVEGSKPAEHLDVALSLLIHPIIL